jgi:ATP-dependent DNA ligase
MRLGVPPPRSSRFGSPLVLSRVHWVRPELVAEVTYLEWTNDGLLRQDVNQETSRHWTGQYGGLRKINIRTLRPRL